MARKPWTINFPDSGTWKLSQYVAVYVWIAALINLVSNSARIDSALVDGAFI